jgi:hypothetical protein
VHSASLANIPFRETRPFHSIPEPNTRMPPRNGTVPFHSLTFQNRTHPVVLVWDDAERADVSEAEALMGVH